MNTVQRIAKNTAAIFSAQITVAVMGVLLTIFIARTQGDVSFGKYSFAVAFTAIFAVLADMGYNTLLIREVARDRSKAGVYLNNVLGIRLVSSIAVFTLIVIAINILNYPPETKTLVYLFGAYTLIASLSAVFKVTFRAFERMEYEAFITILMTLARISIGLLVLYLGYGLVELALVFIASSVIEFFLGLSFCGRVLVKPQLGRDFGLWKSSLRAAVPLGALSIFGLIYTRIDTVMLSIMVGDAAVGWYNASYNLILGFNMIPHLFMNVLFPIMSSYHTSSKDSLRMVYERSFSYLFVLSLPMAVGISMLSEKFILLLYGEQFLPSVITLQILAFDVLLLFMYTCLSFFLVSIDRQDSMAMIVGFSAFFNVILNLLLIPALGYVGAAVATILTEVTLFAVYFYLTSNYFGRFTSYRKITASILASAGMGTSIYVMPDMNLFLLLAAVIGIYFALFHLLGGLSPEDIQMGRSVVQFVARYAKRQDRVSL